MNALNRWRLGGRWPVGFLAMVVSVAIAVPRGSAAAQDTVEAAGVRWLDAGTLPVLGRGFGDAEAWTRLSGRHREGLREPVWRLSRESAGLAVRFWSDAREIRARWTTGAKRMPHMADNAVRGVDLYLLDSDGARYLGTGRVSPDGSHEAALVRGLSRAGVGEKGTGREFALFLPLYEQLGSLEIGVDDGATVGAPRNRWFAGAPVVVYGTSITQGACASRPGMAYPSILSRRLRREVINLGFSGHGRMDLPIADAMTEIDAAVYVIDCLPNLDAAGVAEKTEPFVDALLASRPATPVVLLESPAYPGASARPGLGAGIEGKNRALREAVVSLRSRHPDASVTLVTIEGGTPAHDDLTADGIHPTDAGMLWQASRLEGVLRELLDPAESPGADEEGED